MTDYTPHTWERGDLFNEDQATAMSQELQEQEVTDAAQDADIAALQSAANNESIMVLGDSAGAVCAAYVPAAGMSTGVHSSVDWLYHGNTKAGSPLTLYGSAATAGFTFDQIRTTHLPTVLAARPRWCVIFSGMGNDILASGELPESTFTDGEEVIDELIANGTTPIVCTMLPLFHAANTGVTEQEIARFNNWVVRQSQTKGLPLLRFHEVLVDPATGSYKSGYTADDVHPNTTATAVMADLFKSVIERLTNSTGRYHLAPTNAVITGQAANPLLAGTLGASQVPTGWFNTGDAATGTLAAAPGGAPGNEFILTCDDSGQVNAFGGSVAVAPGDELDMTLIVEGTAAAGGTWIVGALDQVGTSLLQVNYSSQGAINSPAGTVHHMRRKIPVGSTSTSAAIYVGVQVENTVAKVRQVTLRNLTTMDVGV